MEKKSSSRDKEHSLQSANLQHSESPIPIEDDVPPNFFDDFMSEDFIDGLNVVDAWDEEETKKKPDEQTENREKKSHSKSTERERRDPLKTQRDILRDKDKRAKDQKAKLISEKLRVVETGLVPPGTEMETDIAQVESRLHKIRKSVERNRSSPEGGTSGVRKYKPLPPRKSPIRRLPRLRSRSISPIRRRNYSPDRRNYSPNRRTYSPDRRNRNWRRRSASRSPRRGWRSRSRTRSRSPTRKNSKSFLQELNDKLSKKPDNSSFLKELKTTMGFIPAPVPPPQNYILPHPILMPPQQQQQDFNAQFFIGQQPTVHFPHHPSMNFVPQPVPMQVSPYGVVEPSPVPRPQPQQPLPEFIPLAAPQPQPVAKPTAPPALGKEALSKLFNDKKISLSDYLSLTGKCADEATPVNIQNKIKVISDCQDVIKELAAESKTLNKLVVRRAAGTPEDRPPCEGAHTSPFKRIPPVRFQYTTRSKFHEEKPTLGVLLAKLFRKFDISWTIADVPRESPSESTGTPPPPSISDKDAKKVFVRSFETQTVEYECLECVNRKLNASKSVQTIDTMTFDVGCQVSPDDFPKSPVKGILKNQSLAYMTPAQLLANARGEFSPEAADGSDRFKGGAMFDRERGNRFQPAQRNNSWMEPPPPNNSWMEQQPRGFNQRPDMENFQSQGNYRAPDQPWTKRNRRF